MLVKKYTEYDFMERFELLAKGSRILNAGSKSLRYGDNCVNVDIESGPGVDRVCDVHDLPDDLGTFDAVICNAVLQYAINPEVVIGQFHKVLNDDGFLFLDAPWVQPDCPETVSFDRYRFSARALQDLLKNFEIVEIGPSITSGSAFALLGRDIAQHMTSSKYVNYALARIAQLVLFPCRYVTTKRENLTCGAFYAIARKRSI